MSRTTWCSYGMNAECGLFSVFQCAMVLIFDGNKIILIMKLVELWGLTVFTVGLGRGPRNKNLFEFLTFHCQRKKKNEILRSMTMAKQTNEMWICVILFLSKKTIDCLSKFQIYRFSLLEVNVCQFRKWLTRIN